MDEKGFEGLKVWQKAHHLMLNIHTKLIPILPKDEKWGLCDQLRRSSKSIGANIAEGFGRHYYMDNVRFAITPAVHWMRRSTISGYPMICNIVPMIFSATLLLREWKYENC